MFKAAIVNQKGGVTKTTSALHLARCYADAGYKTLLVDADPQGSMLDVLPVKTDGRNIFAFLVKGWAIEECIIPLSPNLDILAGDKESVRAEAILGVDKGAVNSFTSMFPELEHVNYDVVLMDTSPSINLMQNCAAMYCKQLIVPIIMDICAVQGAVSSISGFETLSPEIRPVAFLPALVDMRLIVTKQILESIHALGAKYKVPVLPGIRTDTLIQRSRRMKELLPDFEPSSKAYSDYKSASQELIKLYEEQFNGQAIGKTA
jgi:chromosome partitioning protein